MPKLPLSRLKTLSRKLQTLIALALLVLVTSTLLVMHGAGQSDGAPQTKQAAKAQKVGAVLGASTDANSTEVPATDVSEPSAAVTGPTHQQASGNQPAATGDTQTQTPAPTPPPTPKADPCDKITAGPAVTYSETKISFIESVTIPVGCSTGLFTVKTTDSRTVTFYGFTNKPTSPVRAIMSSAGTSIGTSSTYRVVITDAATPGYYEDFAFIEDPSFDGGGFAVTIQITVIPR
jgi:hypothetical protein